MAPASASPTTPAPPPPPPPQDRSILEEEEAIAASERRALRQLRPEPSPASNVTPQTSPGATLGLTFLSAGMGNSLSAIATNPADIIKVRQQLLTQRKRPGFLRIGIDMARNEGITSLWNGVTAACLREASYSTIRLGSYEFFKEAYGNVLPPSSFAVKLLSGITSGAIGSAIATPTDLLKVRMQAHRPTGRPPYRNTFVGFVEVYREGARAPAVTRTPATAGKPRAMASVATPAAAPANTELAGWSGGVRSLYRGLGPTVLRAAILTSSQIGTYDETKSLLRDNGWMREGMGLHLVASTVAAKRTFATCSPRSSAASSRGAAPASSSSSSTAAESLRDACTLIRHGRVLRAMRIVLDVLEEHKAHSSDAGPTLAKRLEPVILELCGLIRPARSRRARSTEATARPSRAQLARLAAGPEWRPQQLRDDEDAGVWSLPQHCLAALATLYDDLDAMGVAPTRAALNALLATFAECLPRHMVLRAMQLAVGAPAASAFPDGQAMGSTSGTELFGIDTAAAATATAASSRSAATLPFDPSRVNEGLLCTVISVFGRIGMPARGEAFLAVWARHVAERRGRHGGDGAARLGLTLSQLEGKVTRRDPEGVARLLSSRREELEDFPLVGWAHDAAIWSSLIRSRIRHGDVEEARAWFDRYRLVAILATDQELEGLKRPPKSSDVYMTLMHGFTVVRSVKKPPPPAVPGLASRRARTSSFSSWLQPSPHATRAGEVGKVLSLMESDGVEPSAQLANFLLSYRSHLGGTAQVAATLVRLLERGVLRGLGEGGGGGGGGGDAGSAKRDDEDEEGRGADAEASLGAWLDPSTVRSIFRLQAVHLRRYNAPRATAQAPYGGRDAFRPKSSSATNPAAMGRRPESASPFADVEPRSGAMRRLLDVMGTPRALLSHLFHAEHAIQADVTSAPASSAPRRKEDGDVEGDTSSPSSSSLSSPALATGASLARSRSRFVSRLTMDAALEACLAARDLGAALLALRTLRARGFAAAADTRSAVILGWVKAGGSLGVDDPLPDGVRGAGVDKDQGGVVVEGLARSERGDAEARASREREGDQNDGPTGDAHPRRGAQTLRTSARPYEGWPDAAPTLMETSAGTTTTTAARPGVGSEATAGAGHAEARRPRDGGLQGLIRLVERGVVLECRRALEAVRAHAELAGATASSSERDSSSERESQLERVAVATRGGGASEGARVWGSDARPVASWALAVLPEVQPLLEATATNGAADGTAAAAVADAEAAVVDIVMAKVCEEVLPSTTSATGAP